MDTTDRKGDVIITRGDTVTNSRDGGGRKKRGGGGGWWRGGPGQKKKDVDERDTSDSQTHSEFKLNRKTVVISINCTEDWNPV